MSRNKVVIIVLILIASLYVATVLMGFRFNVESGEEPSRDQVKNSWVSHLGDPLSIVYPNLLRCNRQPVDEVFVLTAEKQECDVELPGSDKGVLAATLEVLDPGVAVYERSDAAARHPECRSDAQLVGGRKLKVSYLPEGETHRTPACWLARGQTTPVRMVVLRDGGVLTLRCEGCGPGPSVRLRLQGELR